MKPLAVFILGQGKAAELHAKAFAALPDKFKIVTSLRKADIVDICTPNYLHTDQALCHLENKHVIVEKPLGGSLYDCDLLLDAASRTRNKLLPVFQYRFAADHTTLPPIITTSWVRPNLKLGGWKMDLTSAVGGCILTHKIHVLDLILQRYGKPSHVHVDMFIRAENNLECVCNATLMWPDRTNPHVGLLRTVYTEIVREPNTVATYRLGDSVEGFKKMFGAYHDSIVRDAPLPVSLEQNRSVIELVTALYYSAHTKKACYLPINGQHPFYRGWTAVFQPK